MPLEAPLSPITVHVEELNRKYRHHGATSVLTHALNDPELGKLALVSSFGAESVVLLHLISIMDRKIPVIFLDTEMLFDETLTYQAELAARLRLEDVRVIRPDRRALFAKDPDGLLHLSDPNGCCALRKTRPLEAALQGFDGWITGRKRYHGAMRMGLDFFENDGDKRIKVNPLAKWTHDDLRDYILNNHLPEHPLVAKGYLSIGCAPCTTPVRPDEGLRAGRWRRSAKTECGIHFMNGRAVHGPVSKGIEI